MNNSFRNGLHRRTFIGAHTDDYQMDTINLVSPLNRFRFHGNVTFNYSYPEKPRTRIKLIIGLLIALVVLSALCGYFIGASESQRRPKVEPPDPVLAPAPSFSKLHVFNRGAVCTDAPQCSQIGSDILEKNGSAVDAAIAAMFCNGFLNQQSMGLGGGFFMNVYIKEEGKSYTVIAREKAPAASTPDMFNGDFQKSFSSPLASGVPGELRGMWAAHRRWGALPWADVMAPTLDLCKNGYIMSKALYDGLLSAPFIINDSNLRKVYYDENTKAFYPPGSTIKPSEKLCLTLQTIAEKGGDELYNGSLAVEFLNDLKRMDSIITAEDLRNYEPEIRESIKVPLFEGDILYAPPPPSSGVLLAYILNILSGYNFTADSVATTDNTILTYHRIIEAFKYAYATRTKLGDTDFLDLSELIRNVSSVEYAAATRLRINDSITSNSSAHYGATEYTQGDSGTAHISIIAPTGDAVSITSSINFYFGVGRTTLNTGILLNNVMGDFSAPGITSFFDIKPSPANFIAPNKRPLSSMCPTIITDRYGNAKLVIGASGGTRITTAVALVAIRKLWFDQTIKEAVDAPRIHHQIFPMTVRYEFGNTEDIISGLRAKGHGTERYRDRGSVICALFRNQTGIYANADFRKGGDVVGLN